MDKEQAQKIIRNTFETPFDKGQYIGFVKNLLNRIDDAPFTYKGSYIPDAYKQYIKTLERIGKFSDGENTLDILIITLQRKTSLERARTMLGNYSWHKTDILLPNELFSNTRKTKQGNTGDGILDVFDRYNFTVREDEPLEKEVAIDPELLGKTYEKFNAIRPDNFDEFNFFEIIICYSYLYSTQVFSIFPEGGMDTIFSTLHIFVDWDLPPKAMCLSQKLLVLSQIAVFVFIISYFIGIMSNFRFMRGNEKQ